MNAIPQRAHNYERISIPNTARTMGRVDYIEDYRQKKLSEQRQKNNYSSNRREQTAKIPRQTGVKNEVGGRKLTPAYEVNVGRERAVSAARNLNRSYEPQSRRIIAGYDMNVSGEAAVSYGSVRPVAVEYTSAKRKGVVSTIILIALVFAILSGVLIRFAQISDISYQNAQIQTRISALEQDLEKVQMDIALKEDLNSIKEKARTALGMTYPKDNQIFYLPAEEPITDTAVSTEAANAAVAQPNAAAQTATQEQPPQSTVTVQGETPQPTTNNENGGFFKTVTDTIKGWVQ
ncbi:MAG: hypothetical protein RR777_01165 [Christensenellaceae bacterium]